MDNLDFSSQDAALFAFGTDFSDSRNQAFSPLQPDIAASSGWHFTEEDLEQMSRQYHDTEQQEHQHLPHPYSSASRQVGVPAATAPLHPNGIGLALTPQMNNAASMLQQTWAFPYAMPAQQSYSQNTSPINSYDAHDFAGPLHSSPIEYMPATTASEMRLPMHVSSAALPVSQYMSMAGPMESMSALMYPLNDYTTHAMTLPMAIGGGNLNIQTAGLAGVQSAVSASSPTSASLEIASLSSSDNSWTAVNFAQRHFDGSYSTDNAVFNPGETLHHRTESNSSSDMCQSDHVSGSGEEIMPFAMYSPVSESNNFEFVNHTGYNMSPNMLRQHSDPDHSHECAVHSPDDDSSSPVSAFARPITQRPVSSSSSSTSPTSGSPPAIRRRKSPTGPPVISKTTKAVIRKENTTVVRKSTASDKKVGRRRGPLRPDQRQQAHEIRKLRACLRCKFLKKTCDKGDPCAGCRPSHARLWQVPCTRIDIKDIGFFLKDWKTDFERHISLGFSVNNIKGFSSMERTLYITHGYGHFLPVNAREVYVVDDKCFGVDWIDTQTMNEFEHNTARLSAGMEGVSTTLLSEYLDRHLEDGFDNFVDDYFDGTPFLTGILHTAYKYYQRTKTPVVRKALKLVLAYNLTLHITMVEGLSEEESQTGKVEDETSRWSGKTMAPVMINFQVKCALADMWRELQKDILEELSSLYSSVYQGHKLSNWPTIFMIASILLGVWELMQFDCHYREPDERKVDKFCSDMESTPVGVIVGLFQAISQKLPTFMEWDTSKHAALLDKNAPICDALTEVREHVLQNETYLRGRADAKYDRNDFDSLSNKFLSRLVIRAN